MSQTSTESGDQGRFLALVAAIRPELHRYCARLTGSVIDGEDVVQEAIAKAHGALDSLNSRAALRPWLFRTAHHCALDSIRGRVSRAAEPLEHALNLADENALDPFEQLMRAEAIATAITRFVELPTMQRSAVVLKDILGHSLSDIAETLDVSVDAVKAYLARGRVRLREINARRPANSTAGTHRPENLRYVELFNRRDWDSLRALLAADARLHQATHPPRFGADVGMFFTIYARTKGIRLAPAWLEGRDVIAEFEQGSDDRPHHIMQLEWRDGRIVSIRDYRYVPYIIAEADLIVDGTAGKH